MKRGKVQLLAGAAVAMMTSWPAMAQTDDAEAEQQRGLQEIVVTAQRRAENLQDVPVAVTALSADDLATRGVDDALDLVRYVPNLIGNNNAGLGTANSYYLRGLGNTESIATFDPPVGTYVDSVYVSRQNANNLTFFDVERVEVLRGPQGTLFGRNTTGGAVNVILAEPGDALGGYAEASYGRFDQWTGRASIDLPLGDSFSAKVSGFYVTDDGWARSVTTGERLNDETSWGVRGALKFEPRSGFRWNLSLSYTSNDLANIFNVEQGNDRISLTGVRKAPTVRINPATNQPYLAGRKNNFGLGNRVEQLTAISDVSIELASNLQLQAITGYIDLDQRFLIDFFNGPGALGGFVIANDGSHQQVSQEIKLDGNLLDGRLRFVAGLFYLNEDNSTEFGDIFNSAVVLADRVLDNTTDSSAIYGQIDFDIVTGLTATAGLRFTHDVKKIRYNDLLRPTITPTSLDTASIQALGIPTRQEDNVVTPRLALNWEVASDIRLFASATRGFKSGGWNARGTTAAQILPFGRETVWSYEGGLRSELFNHRLRFNATVFHSDINDLQSPTGILGPDGTLRFITANFTDMRNTGVELELLAEPIDGLTLFGSVGFQDARLTNPDASILAQQQQCRTTGTRCGQGVVTPSGDLADPVRTPDVSVSAGFSWRIGVGNGGWAVIPSADMTYVTDMETGVANGRSVAQGLSFVDDHATVNAQLALSSPDDDLRFAIECKNCFDATFGTNAFSGVGTYLSIPARWSISVRKSF